MAQSYSYTNPGNPNRASIYAGGPWPPAAQGGFFDARGGPWFPGSQQPYGGFAASQTDGRGQHAPNPPTAHTFSDHGFLDPGDVGPTHLGMPPSRLGGEFGRSNLDANGFDQNGHDCRTSRERMEHVVSNLKRTVKEQGAELNELRIRVQRQEELMVKFCDYVEQSKGSNSGRDETLQTLEARINGFLGQMKAPEGSNNAN